MKILVPIRRIPDPDRPIRVVDNVVDPVRRIINPHDEAAVDMAVSLGAEVIAVAIGIDAEDGLLSALARGAHRGYLADTAVDPRSTARALADIYRRESPDLILMGHNPTDAGETAPRLAGMLNIPQATSASTIHVNGSTIRVDRQLDRSRETLELTLPAAVALAPSVEPPSIVSLYAIIDARDRRIDRIAVDPVINEGISITAHAVPAARTPRMVESVDELITVLRLEARVI